MINFMRLLWGFILLLVLAARPGLALAPHYVRLVTPLRLNVGVEHLTLKRRDMDSALFKRQLFYLRSAKLEATAVFHADGRELTLKTDMPLSGNIILGPWGPKDAIADLMFEDSPEVRALYKAGHHPNDPEVLAARKAQQEKLQAYIATDQFIIFDPSSYAEHVWIYCGHHIADEDRRVKRSETICLGDEDRDGTFDHAYKVIIQDSVGLERMKAVRLATDDLSARYHRDGPIPTPYAALVTVRRHHRTYVLQYGLGRLGLHRVWQLSFGSMALYQQAFKAGAPLDSTIFGDRFKIRAARGEKLFGEIEGARTPTVLVRNYGAHLP